MTLLELMIVISIIGILMGLLLTGVVRMREAQRRNTCMSRQRQIGIAVASFEGLRKHLPEASGLIPGARKTDMSVFARLLPYLDNNSLWERVDQERVVSFHPTPWEFGVASIDVQVFSCPSDRVNGGINIRACSGSTHVIFDLPWDTSADVRANGAFPRGRRVSYRDISDGLSNTIGLSEKRKSDFHDAHFSPATDSWLSGIARIVPPYQTDTDEILRLCSLAPNAPSNYYGYMGFSWLYCGYFCTQYNHANSPNHNTADCGVQGSPVTSGVVGIYRASSYHPGGVTALFLDGSTRFMADDVDLVIWRNMATRSGAEGIR